MLPEPYATLVPAVMFVMGQIFVVTSTWALGVTGTFLGDYFGILMDHRVEGYACYLSHISYDDLIPRYLGSLSMS